MSIHIDQIDELRKRTGIGYAEARQVLEENDFQLVEALIALENAGKVKAEAPQNPGWSKTVQKTLSRWMRTHLVLEKKGAKALDASLLIVGLFALLTLPFSVPLALLVLVAGYSPSIVRP